MVELRSGGSVVISNPLPSSQTEEVGAAVVVENPVPRVVSESSLLKLPGQKEYINGTAYDVAVAEGFVGTVSEWLESLKGEPGLPGLPGDGALDLVYNFAVPSTLWVIEHNLGTYAITVDTYNQNGEIWEGNVRMVNLNRVEVDFYYPTAGTARIFK